MYENIQEKQCYGPLMIELCKKTINCLISLEIINLEL